LPVACPIDGSGVGTVSGLTERERWNGYLICKGVIYIKLDFIQWDGVPADYLFKKGKKNEEASGRNNISNRKTIDLWIGVYQKIVASAIEIGCGGTVVIEFNPDTRCKVR
jgi:hypothetical protein